LRADLGPVHKGRCADAGVPFTGHTEFSKAFAGEKVGDDAGDRRTSAWRRWQRRIYRCAISRNAITLPLLRRSGAILHPKGAGILKFGDARPRILVCGLDAGERSYSVTEEMNTIIPVLNELRAQGMKLNGPLPAVHPVFSRNILISPTPCWRCTTIRDGAVLKYHQGFGRGVPEHYAGPAFIRTSSGPRHRA